MTDSATATVEEKPTDATADAKAQEQQRRREEEAEKEASQQRRRQQDAINEAHAKAEEENQKRRQNEAEAETAARMKRLEVQRDKADNFIRKQMSKYEPVKKKDRIEYKFDGADGAEHTVFEKQIKKGNDATPFYGYYGKKVDKEASLAAVLKAVDSGIASVDVHGTEEQKEYLARLAHEHGLRVENYDMSKLGIDQDNLQDQKHEAGLTGKPASKFENDAKPDAEAKQDSAPKTPDPKTPGGGEMIPVNGSVVDPNAAAKQQMEDFNNKLLEGVKSGEIAVARGKNGDVYVSSRYAGGTAADDPNIIDVEAIEVKNADTSPKQLTGGERPKLLGEGSGSRITDPGHMLPAPQDEKPAAEKNADAKKDDAAKPKKNKSQAKGTKYSTRGYDRHDKAHQTPAGKNGPDAFAGNRHNNFHKHRNSTHRNGRGR